VLLVEDTREEEMNNSEIHNICVGTRHRKHAENLTKDRGKEARKYNRGGYTELSTMNVQV
jgi:hypothetical protein